VTTEVNEPRKSRMVDRIAQVGVHQLLPAGLFGSAVGFHSHKDGIDGL
jgi:hypothetical protein